MAKDNGTMHPVYPPYTVIDKSHDWQLMPNNPRNDHYQCSKCKAQYVDCIIGKKVTKRGMKPCKGL